MAFENLNIPNIFLYHVIMENLGKGPDAVGQIVFEAICQHKSVNIKYTDRIKSQLLKKIRTFRKKIKTAHRGTNSKNAFLETIKTSVWSCKVLTSEFEINSLRLEVETLKEKLQEDTDTLKQEVETLKDKLQNKSEMFKRKESQLKKTRDKLKKAKVKFQKEKEFNKRVASCILKESTTDEASAQKTQ